MLGTRGVRLGVVKPGLYGMQVRALMEAAAGRVKAGGNPVVEIMIPLDGHPRGAGPRPRVGRGRHRRGHEAGPEQVDVTIGTMIETPRAAIRADEFAEVADFFCFGTNDLTQMAFGFSRDDVESRMMPAYLEQGLLPRNPFDTIDQRRRRRARPESASSGRKAKPGIKLGVCGEHGGDPESIQLFYQPGSTTCCSPFRVPIARLAAAQAVLGDAASTK